MSLLWNCYWLFTSKIVITSNKTNLLQIWMMYTYFQWSDNYWNSYLWKILCQPYLVVLNLINCESVFTVSFIFINKYSLLKYVSSKFFMVPILYLCVCTGLIVVYWFSSMLMRLDIQGSTKKRLYCLCGVNK